MAQKNDFWWRKESILPPQTLTSQNKLKTLWVNVWSHERCWNQIATAYKWQAHITTKNNQLIMRYTIAAVLTGLIFILKLVFAFLPNVEFVTFFIAVNFIFFPFSLALIICNTSCFLMVLFYGFLPVNLFYFFIFNLYGCLVALIKKPLYHNKYLFIFVMAMMGYIFGTLYALQQWFMFGFAYAIIYWVNGLVFDLIHGTGNGLIAILLTPLYFKIMNLMGQKYPFLFNHKMLIIWTKQLQQKRLLKQNS